MNTIHFPFQAHFPSILSPSSSPIISPPTLKSPKLATRLLPLLAPHPISRAYVSRADAHGIARQGFVQGGKEEEDLGVIEKEAFEKTLRLVECSMFASISGLAYFLSNSLGIEQYFGFLFPLPIVISSVRWGLAAGRKTMVATAILLLTLSGPVKALTYLLMHGIVGLVMGSLWRLKISWPISIVLTALARAVGLLGFVLLSSFLIRENILSLITLTLHASMTFGLQAVGINVIPSMQVIYIIFGFVLIVLNCGLAVFALHIVYAIFLSKLGLGKNFADKPLQYVSIANKL